jgi:hypothetical protein
MVYMAANASGDLLHAVSVDGFNWSRLNNLRQSTKAGPAIASLNDKLRVVFVANNSSNDLLQCIYDDAVDVWTDNVRLNESSAQTPALLQIRGSRLLMYFVQNALLPFLRETDIT